MILEIIPYKLIVFSSETRDKKNIEISYLKYFKYLHLTDTLSNK